MASPPTRSLERRARAFHALSDETRLRLVLLLRHGERCVCDLTDALEAGQSRLSFHLRTLKDAGLVRDRRDGRWVYYALVPQAFEGLVEELEAVKAEAASRQDGCCT